ncbi:MAG: type II secretion system minor pseudopilin GspI [Cellvibrionaceae bacterium]
MKRVAATGFTLVEVMVALLVVGIALPALLSQLVSQADATADLRDRSHAQWVAQNQLEILRLEYHLNGKLLRGEANGNTEMVHRTWHWQVLSEETDMPGMWRQTVNVGTEPEEVIVSMVGFIKEQEAQAPSNGNPAGGGN